MYLLLYILMCLIFPIVKTYILRESLLTWAINPENKNKNNPREEIKESSKVEGKSTRNPNKSKLY